MVCGCSATISLLPVESILRAHTTRVTASSNPSALVANAKLACLHSFGVFVFRSGKAAQLSTESVCLILIQMYDHECKKEDRLEGGERRKTKENTHTTSRTSISSLHRLMLRLSHRCLAATPKGSNIRLHHSLFSRA